MGCIQKTFIRFFWQKSKYNTLINLCMSLQKEAKIQINASVNPCLEEKANFLSRLFFYWTGTLISLGNKKYMQEEDLFDIKEEEKIYNTLKEFEKIRKIKDRNGNAISLSKSIWLLVRNLVLFSGFLSIISNVLQFSGPLVLSQILKFLADPSIPTYMGYVWASILFGCYLIRNYMQQHSMHLVNRVSVLVNNAMYGMIFHKIINMSSASKKYANVGRVMNLVNVDCNAIYGFSQMMLFLFSSPFVIAISIILICLEIGVIGLIGPALLIVGMFIQNIIQKNALKYRKLSLQYTDARSKALSEFFSGIKIIKYYAWENVVNDKIQSIREKEVSLLFKQMVLRGTSDVVSTVVPIAISIGVFGIYAAQGNELSPAKAYTVLSLFNLLQMPLRMVMMVLMTFANSMASLKRLDHFSKCEERVLDSNIDDPTLLPGQIIIKNADYSWDTHQSKQHEEEGKKILATKKEKQQELAKKTLKKDDQQENLLTISTSRQEIPLSLKQISLTCSPGEFLMIVGQVGSGKSSLLNGVLNEINKERGEFRKNGSIAFIPQTAWLMNASIRENILFGKAFDEHRYHRTLQLCELEKDLEVLPGGDQTEVGERGINLSGGQKQRVSLARALYSNSDIYVIDDCLAALDAHVGKQVFANVLKKELKGKTILFVTHALHYVRQADPNERDRVIVMKSGIIEEQGKWEELMALDGEFKRLNVQYKEKEDAEEGEEEEEIPEELLEEMGIGYEENKYLTPLMPVGRRKEKKDEVKRKKSSFRVENKVIDSEQQKKIKGELTKVEGKAEGSVPWHIYSAYITSGGTAVTTITFLCFILAQGVRVVNDWWLGAWSEKSFDLNLGYYVLIYGCLSIFSGLMVFFRSFFFGRFAMNTAQSLQMRLIKKLLHSPLWWFDITPSGRILSRTTKDQDAIDGELPWGIQFSLSNLLILLSSIIMTGVITPLFFIFAVIGLIVYSYLVKLYVKAAREIKRIELNSRAPVISHFSETCNGIYVIRSFRREEEFLQKFYEKSVKLTRALQNFQFAGRWIANYSEIFGSCLVAGTAYFGVLSRSYNYLSNPALIGLALSWALNISTMISFTIRLLASTESQMSSVQRIIDYIENNPSEADFDLPKPKSSDWPLKGVYEATNVSYKYRKELSNVIHGIDFKIRENEKIGVVGRTGSGKSTLTLGLLRILEIGEGGKINLDGEDLSQLGLHQIRKKTVMIPQDPTLFTGTIRFNIDPFNEFTDSAIIDALQKVHIFSFLTKPSDNQTELEMKVTDGGSNFSLGQRQLICMARALIRKPKILLMDEATASIDEMTDHLIQDMIRSEFKETTVITIAHRLNTIIQYDRIMVLDQGKIVEFDTPDKLLGNEESYFGHLIKEGGKVFEENMRALARRN